MGVRVRGTVRLASNCGGRDDRLPVLGSVRAQCGPWGAVAGGEGPGDLMRLADPALIEAFETSSYQVNDDDPVEAGWYWLSFTDSDLPEGSQFLGACMVKAAGQGLALSASHMTGLNPGGAVMIAGPVPDEVVPEWQPRWALMSREEIATMEAANPV